MYLHEGEELDITFYFTKDKARAEISSNGSYKENIEGFCRDANVYEAMEILKRALAQYRIEGKEIK